ncbi:hypothetical protein MKW98_006265 [Papaver atlanticum]|uniref:Protein kinase domain-containing protein n=1 Tax=Papaver atlanticum TaxID=357466 RepID=A0AAD4TH63_9MAGN|nr:hypothetical protein MKW98_006265 [Papaver atlanticum]
MSWTGEEVSIGEGSYGRIYFGVSGTRQAATDDNQEPSAQVYIESRIKHDTVIEFVGYCCVDGSPRVSTYEFNSMGSLHDILHGVKGDFQGAQPGQVLSWAQRVKIFVDVAKGLRDLHDKGQPNSLHHDINSNNVLLLKDHVSKTSDSDVPNQTPVMEVRLATFDLGPFAWNAMTGQPDQKSDVYKYGVVLAELLTGRKPVDLTLPKKQQKLVKWFMKSLSSYREAIEGANQGFDDEKVRQLIDERLGDDYPLKGVVKAVKIAEMCLGPEPDFRPTMEIVVRALQPLLHYDTTVPLGDQNSQTSGSSPIQEDQVGCRDEEDFGVPEDLGNGAVEEDGAADEKDKPVNVPALSASIEEGSYGRVYIGVSESAQAAAVDQDPLTQVYMESRLKHENIIELIGYYVDGSPRFPGYEFDTIGSLLKHENIIKLLDHCVDGSLRVPAYEFDTIGSLQDVLRGDKGDIEGAPLGQVLSWAQRFQIAIDVAKGLRRLHDEDQPKTMRHDINSSNVLLFKDHVANLVDFDLSNRTPVIEARLATFDLGPCAENVMTGQPDQVSDIYKYGVILLELVTGRKPDDLVEWYMKFVASYRDYSYLKEEGWLGVPDCACFNNQEKVARLAELCFEGQFPPTMDYVVKYFELMLLELDAGLYD